MENPSQSAKRQPPICGLLSAVTPLIGLGIAYIVRHSAPTGEAALGYGFISGLFFLGSLVCGVVLAVVGTARCERFRALPWVALFINAIPFLWIIVRWR